MLVETRSRAATQEAILAELLPNTTRTVLQVGTYNLFLDWGLSFVGEEMEYRIVEVANVVMLEMDLPTATWNLVPGAPYYSLYAVNFSPEVLIAKYVNPTYVFITQRNREQFRVSSGCLATGDCALLGQDQDMNLIPNLVRINSNHFYIDTFLLVGSGLSGEALSFGSGPWVFPIPSA